MNRSAKPAVVSDTDPLPFHQSKADFDVPSGSRIFWCWMGGGFLYSKREIIGISHDFIYNALRAI